MTTFDYSNLSDRTRGPFLTAAGWVLPGIRRVHEQGRPYAAAWRRDNLAALEQGGPLWVALGDSLTQGIGASAHDRGWVGQVRDRLAAEGRPHRVVNLGVSGARVEDLIERQLPVLETLDAALVTVMIGSNDVLWRKYRRGLVERFETMLARLPQGTVVTTLPNPTPTAAAVNRSIERAARDRGLVVAELRDPRTTSWRGKLAADHFHPNDRGYEGLAAVVGDAVLRSGR
ncbi:SGNH/GDSL hydrolase family protein [Jatrophihabitans fulvus]